MFTESGRQMEGSRKRGKENGADDDDRENPEFNASVRNPEICIDDSKIPGGMRLLTHF